MNDMDRETWNLAVRACIERVLHEAREADFKTRRDRSRSRPKGTPAFTVPCAGWVGERAIVCGEMADLLRELLLPSEHVDSDSGPAGEGAGRGADEGPAKG